ncbi:phosphotransferase [Odoribacter sp. OttesenSCG-928-J03]|nr:phosphotransferase [Odoribacter sp. OttesenSCG-928-J03]MDL2283352.1 phosphotransferase [Odoribacter sp. OttesenSCG-928-G04]
MKVLLDLFASYTGETAESIEKFPSSGSNRSYFRMKSLCHTLIGVHGASKEENEAFIYISKHFKTQNIPVPEVYMHSEDYHYYLQEDLGDQLLFDAIEEGRKTGTFSENEKALLKKTVKWLPMIQFNGAENMDFSRCFPLPEFNKRSVLWDLNYFKYCFLKATGLEFSEEKLEDDFECFAETLLADHTDTFMYRDFQSRNVMIRNGEPYFIDFQGGRKGPVYYDIASFLWQARASYPQSLREELLDDYIKALNSFIPVNAIVFKEKLRHFVLFRLLQVLGAYGFRGYFEKKSHFILSVPPAIENLRELLKQGYPEYPYLCEVLNNLTSLDRFAPKGQAQELEVRVCSFAYKNGIPEDNSGNGGGFVFDCRAIHNPGKYDEYKKRTGLDKPVIDFLEKDGEICTFLEHVYALVDASVERYLRRGFTNLSVSFGCTGGQHRSVYAAQHLAEHLTQKYKVKVILHHREQEKR